MGIYRRGSVWRIDYYDQNRARVQESSYSSNRRHAQDLLCLRESEVLRGIFKRPVKIGLNTGLRVGEIFSLRWSSVDMQKGILNILAQKTGKMRTVPLNTEVRNVLEVWAMGRKNDFVFYNHETGKPFVDLKAGFALACRKAGISDVSWHTLRHTFASRLIDRGVDIVTVQQLLGHSTVTVTMRYTHTNLDSKKAAVAKLVGFGDNLVTVAPKCSNQNPQLSQMAL